MTSLPTEISDCKHFSVFSKSCASESHVVNIFSQVI